MKSRRPFGSLLAAAALAAVLVAVFAPAGGGQTTAELTKLKARLAQYSAVPKFIPPGPPFDASKARGKTIFSITISSEIPFCNALDESQKKVSKLMGIKYIEYPNQGRISQWVEGMNQAIAQKVDLILLSCAPNPAVLQPQIAAAKRAGIPVTMSPSAQPEICETNPSFRSVRYKDLPNCFTTYRDVLKKTTAGLAAHSDGPYPEEAALMADWAIVQTNGKLNAFVIKSSEVYTADPIVDTFGAEMKRWCPQTCKMKVVNVPIVDWATKIQSSVQTALLADPSINYVMPIYDSMNQFVVPGIVAARRTDDLHTVSYNGTPFVLKMMQQGNTVAADLGESLDWKGYIALDQAMRVLTGTKPAPAALSPLRLWTKANVNHAGTPPTIYQGYGNAYVAGFKKLWGMK